MQGPLDRDLSALSLPQPTSKPWSTAVDVSSGRGSFCVSVLWSTPHHWPCRRSLRGAAGGREPEPPALEEGGGRSLQKLYTASGNVYPLPVISESVKTVIADLPRHGERAGWQGLLLSCSLRHSSLFTGGLWTAGRLSGGSGASGCCFTPPACSWAHARNPGDQSWGGPCQDAQRGSYWGADVSLGSIISSHSCLLPSPPATGPEKASPAPAGLLHWKTLGD